MFKRLWKKEDGQVLVMVALLLGVLLAFAALVIDVGYFYAEKRQLQTAVDAAALAAAKVAYEERGSEKREDDIIKATQYYLEENTGKLLTLEEIKDEQIVDIKEEPLTATVNWTTDYPTFFARIFESESTNIQADAVAKIFLEKIDLAKLDFAIFSQDEILTMNGNKFTITGDVYTGNQSEKFEDDIGKKIEVDGEVTYGLGKTLPVYSELEEIAVSMTYAKFKEKYIDNANPITGVIKITDEHVSISSDKALHGTGVIYVDGSLNLKIKIAKGSSILYYATDNITVQPHTTVYGGVFSQMGTITLDGGPNIEVYGSIYALGKIDANGAKLGQAYENDDGWMVEINRAIPKLIK